MDRNEKQTPQRNMGSRTRGVEKKIQKYKRKTLILAILCGVLLILNLILVGRFVIWPRVKGQSEETEEEIVYVDKEETETATPVTSEIDNSENTSQTSSDPEAQTMTQTDMDGEKETESETMAETATESDLEIEGNTEETSEEQIQEVQTNAEAVLEEVFSEVSGVSYRLVGVGKLQGIDVSNLSENSSAGSSSTSELGELFVLGTLYSQLSQDEEMMDKEPNLRALAEVMMGRAPTSGTDSYGYDYNLPSQADAADQLLKRIGGYNDPMTDNDENDGLSGGLKKVDSFCEGCGFGTTTIVGAFSDNSENETSLTDVTEFFVKLYEVDSGADENGLGISTVPSGSDLSYQKKLEEILGMDYADGKTYSSNCLLYATCNAADWTPKNTEDAEDGDYFPKVMWVSASASDTTSGISSEYTVMLVLTDSSGEESSTEYDTGYVLGVFCDEIVDSEDWNSRMETLAQKIYDLMLPDTTSSEPAITLLNSN